MGKTTDALKKLQDVHDNKYSLAMKKAAEEKTKAFEPKVAVSRSKAWIWKTALAFSILLILCFNVTFFFTLKSFAAKEKENKVVKKSSVSKTLKSKSITKIVVDTKQKTKKIGAVR